MKPKTCREARERLGWSLTDLARLSSVPFAKLVLFECGHTGAPDMLEKLTATFAEAGVDFSDPPASSRFGRRLADRQS